MNFNNKIVTDGLVLCLDAADTKSYPGSGTIWYDRTKNKYNGTLTNGPTFNSGNGGHIVFDGTNDYVSISSINPTVSAFTCETFFQWSTIENDKNSLFSLCYEYPNKGYLIRQNNIGSVNGKIIVWSDNGTETYVISTQTLLTATWYNLTVVQNSGTCLIYINGVLDSSQALANPVLGTTSNTFIGSRAGTGAYLNGKVAISKIYNRVLSASEVLQNFNAQRKRFNV
jgi:Concanavalin A-like lectin/glucanases superfamily